MQQFDANGNEHTGINLRADVTEPVYDIGAVLNRGNIPDFDKKTLDGQDVTIVGISGPEEFPMGPVYFVLLYRDSDPRTIDAWGVMMPATSPAIKRTLAMAKGGYLPFRAKLVLEPSQSHKGYEYWNLKNASAPALEAAKG
jgi:hypothetical protein